MQGLAGNSIEISKIKEQKGKIQCKKQKCIRFLRGNDNGRLITCCSQISPLRNATHCFGRNDKDLDCIASVEMTGFEILHFGLLRSE
jgi:hypothetical protein